ncbi:OprO/OprP family phosphate-selective porin [Coralloluteibacterium stylophorae]|uniref:Porin n=1 Tax=Coralloluteibacterium stylophorae TaxID=1776034 RepID=A0A8J8AYY1_9GAMM|nr:porin [Coralloluteibacterium stylophorae]MBS7457256.1 porin [Coralloluteibacterium stylophorae]
MRSQLLVLTLGLVAGPAHAQWPAITAATPIGDSELAFTANWAYDHNAFHHVGEFGRADGFRNDSHFRRRETGFVLRRKGVYDFTLQYDFEAEVWMDVALRLQSEAFLGRDVGALRLGQFKTPVGFDSVGSSRNAPFLEPALPVQVAYAGRRVGAEWSLQRPHALASVAWFGGNDLEGDNAGQTAALRAAWVPRNAAGDVLHLGVAASREEPDSASFRMRARPEAGLTLVRLVDTGSLEHTEAIHRVGLEGLWIEGPWSLQGEVLDVRAARGDGFADVTGRGAYVFGSWVVTGESRGYNGYATNVVPAATSALELLLRYSALDLDDGGTRGGCQSDWTVGANWYVGRNLKFQANYVFAHSDRQGVVSDPEVFGLRAQLFF